MSKNPRQLFLFLIRLYQNTLSLDHGPLKFLRPLGQCKFYPTCSEYTHQAIERYGIAYGMLVGIKRILRCNPWSEGGVEELL